MKETKYGRTLILLKPDAIKRGLAGEILKRFERKGLKIVAAELRMADEKLAKEHYSEHKNNKNYFPKIIEALTTGPLMAVVLEGPFVIESSRQLIGSQSPIHGSQIGTIRADFSIEEPYNLVHGSDSYHAAIREITLWFNKEMAIHNQPEEEVQLAHLADMPVAPSLPKKEFGKKKVLPWPGGNSPFPPVIEPSAHTHHIMPVAAPPLTEQEFIEAQQEILKSFSWSINQDGVLTGSANT